MKSRITKIGMANGMDLAEAIDAARRAVVYSTDIIEHSGLKYRIELRDNSGIWQQRHVWYPAPKTYIETEMADNWIRSPCKPDATFKPRKQNGE